ncbi:MAG: hypothetical protein K5780_05850 [Alphaproteobacteria bacterium]|nr:hypothetical protein [Alphaproteobacteria bacterium]
MRFLFLLLAVCSFSSVHADVLWPSVVIALGKISIPVIIAGLLIEIGFVKYFTKVGWRKTIVVAVLMNAVSATFGSFLIYISKFFDAILHFIMINYFLLWLISYLVAVLINTVIEGITIRLILKLPLSKTFRWLSAANVITIGICVIYLYLFPKNVVDTLRLVMR